MSASTLSVIGLTGGIASGKSTVAARLRAHGVPVIDADQVAREVVERGEAALDAIVRRFGAGVLRPDGALDRKALGGIVFAAPAALADLNAITHPAIMSRVAVHARALAQQGHGWAVYEAALILEHELSPHLSQLIAVICEPETQVTRIMARDHLSEAEARLRLAAQTDNATRVARADVILRNDGSLDALLEATDALVEALKAHYQG
jgi:dephospho-CoA kinase